jgi:hypothetical protein
MKKDCSADNEDDALDDADSPFILIDGYKLTVEWL